MKLTVLFYLLLAVTTWGQDFTISAITALETEVYETSGLLFMEDRVITHNDSGGQPWLYEIDTTDGSVSRTVVIANASNIDWEELAMDELYMYICDFGNNSGTRTDLCVYKISIDDYLTTPNDTVYCDTVRFSYADQDDFTPATYTTNFDAEAMVAIGDSLYIFTKNWGNYKTHIYALSKVPGDYSINKIDELVVDCLITGADYDIDKNELMFTGYTLVDPILILVHDFESTHFSEGTLVRYTAGLEGSIQIEGISSIGNHQFLVSSEKKGSDPSMLHEVTISNFVSNESNEPDIVPASSTIFSTIINAELKIAGAGDYNVKIYSTSGQLVHTSNGNSVDFSNLENGIYIIHILDNQKNVLHSERILKVQQ